MHEGAACGQLSLSPVAVIIMFLQPMRHDRTFCVLAELEEGVRRPGLRVVSGLALNIGIEFRLIDRLRARLKADVLVAMACESA